MRKILFGVLISVSFAALAVIGGGVLQHTHSSASSGGTTLVVTNLTSAKACAAGHTRIAPNTCMRLTNPGSNVISGACQALTNPDSSATTGGIALIIDIDSAVPSNNVVGLKSHFTTVFSTAIGAGCATGHTSIFLSAYEFNASGVTTIAKSTVRLTVPLAARGANGSILGSTTLTTFTILGYHD